MNKFLFVAALALSGGLGGCGYLQPPEAEPTPAKPKLPKSDFFDATDNVKAGTPLPGFYNVVGVDTSSDPDSGEVVVLRSVTIVKGTDGKDKVVPNPVMEKVRLAGIIMPPKGSPGRDLAVSAINGWTSGKTDLEVEGDSQYPTDLQGRRVVQIYFKGTGKETTGKKLNLNRMLVRSGFAVVDLHQASSIHHEKWFNDEQYARLRRDPNDANPVLEKRKPAPLGLWKLGILLAQRPPVPGLKSVVVTTATADGKRGATAPVGGVEVTKTTTTATKTVVKTTP